jgi:hypothetical protein
MGVLAFRSVLLVVRFLWLGSEARFGAGCLAYVGVVAFRICLMLCDVDVVCLEVLGKELERNRTVLPVWIGRALIFIGLDLNLLMAVDDRPTSGAVHI